MKKEIPPNIFEKVADLHNNNYETKNKINEEIKKLEEEKSEQIKKSCQRLFEIEYGLTENNPFVFVPIGY